MEVVRRRFQSGFELRQDALRLRGLPSRKLPRLVLLLVLVLLALLLLGAHVTAVTDNVSSTLLDFNLRGERTRSLHVGRRRRR